MRLEEFLAPFGFVFRPEGPEDFYRPSNSGEPELLFTFPSSAEMDLEAPDTTGGEIFNYSVGLDGHITQINSREDLVEFLSRL